MTTDNACQHTGCTLPLWGSTRWCILHNPDPSKDAARFHGALEQRLKDGEQDIDLSGVHFVGPSMLTYWSDRDFARSIFFKDAHFHSETSFHKTRFHQGAYFEFAHFDKPTKFWGAHFYQEASFSSARFYKEVSFGNANFCREANFGGARFHQKADFEKACFHHEASFSEAHFCRQANFGGTQFRQEAKFWHAEFHEKATFSEAEFQKRTDFSNGIFSEADFSAVQFQHGANFWEAHFCRGANFGRARFARVTHFDGAHFDGARFVGAYFGEAQFRGETVFNGTKFCRKTLTRFDECKVGGHVHFLQAQFPGAWQEGRVLFPKMRIEPNGEVLFEEVDLSRASFLRTDLSRVRFRNVTWATRSERVWPIPWLLDQPGMAALPWPKVHRQALFDHLEKEEPHLVGELYRALRLSLEPTRQEVEAGDFYIGQMDMRRQDTEHFHWSYRWLLGFYRFAALYGENWQRPLALYVLLGLAFAFIYLLAGFEGIGSSIHYRPLTFEIPGLRFMGDYAQALAHALTAGGILQQDLALQSPWAPLTRYANAVADIFLLALTVIALRRRFRR